MEEEKTMKHKRKRKDTTQQEWKKERQLNASPGVRLYKRLSSKADASQGASAYGAAQLPQADEPCVADGERKLYLIIPV